MKYALTIIFLLLIHGVAVAQTIFLDNNPKVRIGCSNYDPVARACSGGSYKAFTSPWDASQALKDGDTLCIRQGEYHENVTVKPGYNWAVGALRIDRSNITIQNYRGEEVWIKGGPSRTSVLEHTNNALSLAGSSNRVVGIGHKLHFYGCVVIIGTANTVQGCDLSGGWDHQSPIGGDAWYDVVRFYKTVDATVRDCRIHDNFNHGTATNVGNMALIMHEKDINTIVENNHIYNPVASYVFAKYQTPDHYTIQATYRFNRFGPESSNKLGSFSGTGIFYGKQVKVYQNIFENCGAGFGKVSMSGRTFVVYNNTFYNVAAPLSDWSGGSMDAHQFFNNIVYTDSGSNYAVNLGDVQGSIGGEYIDHNNYHAAGSGRLMWNAPGNRKYSSLGAWKSATGKDENSTKADPGFLNASGRFSRTSDFKRSSYPRDGRGQGWPSVRGAYITGAEIIGLIEGE